jgi:hypothetical protein
MMLRNFFTNHGNCCLALDLTCVLASNSTAFQETAKTEAVINQDLETKILGMRWDPEQDILTVVKRVINTKSTSISKREILRQSSSIFDPLGLLGNC